MKKIVIVGVGGRTGTMFAFELAKRANVLGIGRKNEIEIIKEKRVFLERKNEKTLLFNQKVIEEKIFNADLQPDVIFITTKNSVSPVIKFYYQKFKGKKNLPILLISQNGIAAIEDAKKTLKEVFGNEWRKITIVRLVLFNPVEKKESENKIFIQYSLPLKIALAKVVGPAAVEGISEIFRQSNFEVYQFPPQDAKNLEFSKLFLNLIGMASASRKLSIEKGFKEKEVFKEEILALREYVETVKRKGGKFLNFPQYPVKWLSLLVKLPLPFLIIFRKKLAKIISKGREEKPKDLEEIEFYNGAVVKLGKQLKISTPINAKICGRVRI